MAFGSRVVRFGAYEVDLRTGELRKCGLRLKLQDKAFQVLSVLLAHAGEAVVREQFRERLWPGNTSFDFEHSLSIAVHKLRVALCDAANNPRFIETLPRRGYRFIAPVQSQATPASSGKTILIVLPVTAFDPVDEPFADALTEELTAQLGRTDCSRLGVLARTTAMQYRRRNKSIAEVGCELDLDYAIEGSVRHHRKRMRITVQLIHAADQTHVWAESYNREMKDLLAVETDVAELVTRAVRLHILSRESPGSNAYELPGEQGFNAAIATQIV